MNTKLIQHLDEDGQAIGLYLYNGDLMDYSDVRSAIDKAFGEAIEAMRQRLGDDEDAGYVPSDVDEDADERLSAIGIERMGIDEHTSAHF